MVNISVYNQNLDNPNTVLDLAIDAYNVGQFDLCCILCEAGLKLSMDQNLRYAYNELLCLSGFKTQVGIRRQKSKDIADHISYLKNVPYDKKYKILKELSFHTPNIFQLAPSTTLIPIEYVPPDNWFSCNLSVTNYNNEIIGILRAVNYDSRKFRQEGFYIDNGPYTRTRNFLLRFNENFHVSDAKEILYPIDFPEKKSSTWAAGFEDARIFILKNEIWFSSSCMELSDNAKAKIFVSKITPENDCYRMTDWYQIVPKNGKDETEKNWMPLIINDVPYFVYNSDPVTIMDKTGSIVSSKTPCIDASTYRGSSHLVPFDDGYLAIVHESVLLEDIHTRNMLHRFVMYDHWGNLIKVSEPFYINHIRMEMIIGMCWNANKTELIAGISFEDRTVFILKLNSNEIRNLLKNVESLGL